jgi:hypothetical protein
VREEQEVWRTFYRVEEEGEGARPRRWKGKLGRPPLMPAGLGGAVVRRFREGGKRGGGAGAFMVHLWREGKRRGAPMTGGATRSWWRWGHQRLRKELTGGSHRSAAVREGEGKVCRGWARKDVGRCGGKEKESVGRG